MTKTAAALIIGNELLTGKIQELNLAYLGKELYRLGIQLRRVVMCLDDIDTIAADLNLLRDSHDYVFTSGGVGPTHDDMTLPAVAKAFAVPLVRVPEIEGLIRQYHGDRATEAHLRMADAPEGSTFISNEQVRWPTVCIGNVLIFPGVPEIFRAKFAAVRPHLTGGARFYSHAVFTHCDEGEIALQLRDLEASFAGVSIGSYPTFRDPAYRTKVTFDGRDPDEITRAAETFCAQLDPQKIVRQEGL
ncbi:MAG: competence/damage-inducible protein A [Myxococcales bacterium]|nr:competence/damage-inducible protein A [Myxococcales bacterium]